MRGTPKSMSPSREKLGDFPTSENEKYAASSIN
jgi:hypothetical protein